MLDSALGTAQEPEVWSDRGDGLIIDLQRGELGAGEVVICIESPCLASALESYLVLITRLRGEVPQDIHQSMRESDLAALGYSFEQPAGAIRLELDRVGSGAAASLELDHAGAALEDAQEPGFAASPLTAPERLLPSPSSAPSPVFLVGGIATCVVVVIFGFTMLKSSSKATSIGRLDLSPSFGAISLFGTGGGDLVGQGGLLGDIADSSGDRESSVDAVSGSRGQRFELQQSSRHARQDRDDSTEILEQILPLSDGPNPDAGAHLDVAVAGSETLVTSAGELAGQSTRSSLLAHIDEIIDFDYQSVIGDWSIKVEPYDPRYRGLANTTSRAITLYVHPVTDVEIASRVLMHEVGHVIDIEHLSDPDRAEWLRLRGIDAPWWPQGGMTDFAVGAGDFAEAVAHVISGSASVSQFGGYDEAELSFVRKFLEIAVSKS